jgi:cytosine/uracil/thiamine/allantoin permease
MKRKIKHTNNKYLRLLILGALMLGFLMSCSPYAGVDIGVPFKIGPVYVNPSIGVGGLL